jgi:hypothetical protein
MLGVRLGVVGILAREDVKVLTVYVDLSVICDPFFQPSKSTKKMGRYPFIIKI